ncbi:MAG: hypothetical protein P1P88_01020 [Bacteroidales bacterium]|nr:hypothetical protein [Bacteroidales bacterium]
MGPTNKYPKAWFRIQSHSRAYNPGDDPEAESKHINEGLKAKTADPLWFITQQWMMGEFMAEDAGSLVKTELEYYSDKVNYYTLGQGTNSSYTNLPRNLPLETLIEREIVPWDWRMIVRAGQQFERFVRQNLDKETATTELAALMVNYSIRIPEDEEMDEASRTNLKLVEGKVLNGKKIYENRNAIKSYNLSTSIDNFISWYKSLYSQTQNNSLPQWKTKTLDYSFGVKTENGPEIVSDNYRNGDLEWYSSNMEAGTDSTLNPPDDKFTTISVTPNRVKFAGMPHPRWWAMEDSIMDFGKIDPNTTELIKLMLMNYTLTQGDDWFVVPLILETGTITLVRKIITTDSFGVQLEIPNGRFNSSEPLDRWDLFSLSKQDNPAQNADLDFLYIPPSCGFREESQPLEEVLFLRDEFSNIVFGIEKTIPNAWGNSKNALEFYFEKEVEEKVADSPVVKDMLKFKLATKIAPNWIPYQAQHIAEEGNFSQVFLKQAQIPNPDKDISDLQDEIGKSEPLSNILQESQELNEETITRAGLKVQIKKQRMRWIDGKTYVWIGRNILTGRGEGNSGLKWDVILDRIRKEVGNGS